MPAPARMASSKGDTVADLQALRSALAAQSPHCSCGQAWLLEMGRRMTVIAAVVDSGQICLGADASISDLDSPEITTTATPKAWRNGNTVCGWAGDWAPIVAVHHALDLSLDIHALARQARSLSLSVGAEQSCLHGLVAREGRLWYVAGGYALELSSVQRVGRRRRLRGYGAIGSGAPWAQGALHESSDGEWTPGQRVERALCAAEAWCSTVRRGSDGWRIFEIAATRKAVIKEPCKTS